MARLARAKIAADPKAVSLVDSHSCPMAEPYCGVQALFTAGGDLVVESAWLLLLAGEVVGVC